ncbi:unnamed protein product [Phytomonas sp. Hart1]|nr:unnamed protein product [Phytomonas sp. Hart1]|eukprot:CCW68291.1 unnamed protein product [Phytomonas sp. isolate Hart1]
MQVIYNTFAATLPYFVKLLKTCDFYAFDEEMTGVALPNTSDLITFSTAESYYFKRMAAKHYNLIQVGLCLFHRTGSTGGVAKYTASPFNFVLFPQSMEETGGAQFGSNISSDIVLSSSAMAFHRRQEMDFQSWVYQGIGFCDKDQADVLRNHWKRKRSEISGSDNAEEKTACDDFTDEEKSWVAASIKAAEELKQRADTAWCDATTKNMNGLLKVNQSAEAVKILGTREVLLENQSSKKVTEHLAKYLKTHLPSVTVTYRRQGKMFAGTLCVFTEDEIQSKIAKEKAACHCDELNSLGFRLVFEELVNSKKPCVGHNCFTDLLFLLTAFDQILPEDLPSWKARVKELFPTILDTKYIATRVDRFPMGYFPKLYLGGLFENYGMQSQKVEVSLPLGFQNYDPLTLMTKSHRNLPSRGPANPSHEAGYDALMTGTLLLNLLAELGCNDVREAPADLINKVSIFRSLYAVDLSKADSDEYTPGERVILNLRFSLNSKWSDVETCAKASGVANPVTYDVEKGHLILVLPPLEKCESDTIADTLSKRFPDIIHEVSVYKPPHLV